MDDGRTSIGRGAAGVWLAATFVGIGAAIAVVLKTRRPSISLVQRHLRIGYNRSARLIEAMEAAGLVSAMDARGARDVLMKPSPE